MSGDPPDDDFVEETGTLPKLCHKSLVENVKAIKRATGAVIVVIPFSDEAPTFSVQLSGERAQVTAAVQEINRICGVDLSTGGSGAALPVIQSPAPVAPPPLQSSPSSSDDFTDEAVILPSQLTSLAKSAIRELEGRTGTSVKLVPSGPGETKVVVYGLSAAVERAVIELLAMNVNNVDDAGDVGAATAGSEDEGKPADPAVAAAAVARR